MPDETFDPNACDDPHALDLPWDKAAEPLEEEQPVEDQEEPSEADDEAAFKIWWAHRVPDFVKHTYPFDLPPERLPFAQQMFTWEGAPKYCPVPACRRTGQCLGGDGPPCFRADRDDLQQVLFLWWAMLFEGLSQEEYVAALRGRGNRYGPHHEPPAAARRRPARRSKAVRRKAREA